MMQLADELWESYICFMASLSEEGSLLASVGENMD